MRLFFVFLLGLLLGCSGGPARAVPVAPTATPVPSLQDQRAAMAENLRELTVALVGFDDDGDMYGKCAGVWVSSTTIITARHCVGTDTDLGSLVSYAVWRDIFPNNIAKAEPSGAHVGRFYAFDDDNDLALLKAPAPPAHGTAVMHVGPVRPGTFAQTMGQPFGLWYSYASGDVAAVRERSDGGLLVQTTLPVNPGNSGGGLFDDEGALIGIGHRMRAGALNVNSFVHVQHVEELLEMARKKHAL